MRAAVRERYGPPDVVEVREVDRPLVSDDRVLVRVHAASVNRADLDVLYPRWRFFRLFTGLRRPRQPGLGVDIAGVVEAVGPQVARFKVGDRVFGDLFNFGAGAFADYASAPERAFQPMPDAISFEDAATLPHSAILALQGLRHPSGRSPQPGQRVLVVGASGNVGPFAIQIAKSMGTHVTGVASDDKLDFVRSLGADEVIDYRTTDYTRTGDRWDWVVDVDAHHSLLRWRGALAAEGVYVSLGGTGRLLLQSLLLFPRSFIGRRRLGLMLWWRPFHPEDVDRLKELIAMGKLRPVINRRFPLSEVVAALRHVDEGLARGKVVVTS
jgi:NADPH:quinone reductase-like Zn-dependent oxidoreductase